MVPRPKYLITTSALLASPSVLAVMVLSAVGALNIWIACLAGMAILIGVLVLLIRPLRRLRGIENQLSSLTDRAPDADIAVHTSDAGGPVGDIIAAIYRLDRIWGHNRKELHYNLQAAQILFDALPDPLLTLDADARLIYTNAAAQELLVGRHGISDLTGRDLSAVIRQPTILGAVESALSGEPTRTIEFTTADQVDQIFEARIEPIVAGNTNQDTARALILLRDVTELRRGEQMRADFVANVSHELRTPLTSLVGFIETLRGPARGDMDAQDRFLDLMQNQSNRMTRIVNDLLSLSRIEMNEHTAPDEHVSLQQVINTVADLLTPQARDSDVTIELDLDDLDTPVIGHQDELTQLFQNLIENAIKYGGAGSKVLVTGEVSDAFARVSVIDEGDGIPREHIPRLTERFYRVDTARSREMGGTGLGLAIVKHIANRHRGKFSIRSEPGIGSEFTIALPLATRSAD